MVVSLNRALGKQGRTLFRDSFFRDNVGFSGSGIFAERQSLVHLVGCGFHGNVAFNEGGAIVASLGSNVSARNCSFFGNRASYGGALYADLGSSVGFENTLFVANEATFGACCFCGISSALNMSVCSVSFHVARFDRAAIILEGASGYFSYTNFSSNKGQTGGVLYVLNSSSTFVECIAIDNSASLFGGFAAVCSSNLTVKGGRFESISAGVSAGVFYVVNYAEVAPSTVSLENSLFLNNQNNAAGWGGVLYLSSVKQASIRGCKFTGNQAGSGGVVAVAWGDRGLLEVTDCVAQSNNASGDGGFVYAYIRCCPSEHHASRIRCSIWVWWSTFYSTGCKPFSGE